MNTIFSTFLAIILFFGSTANFCAPNYSTNHTNTNDPAESKKWQYLDKMISEQDSTDLTPHTLGIIAGLAFGLGASLNDEDPPVITDHRKGALVFSITWPTTFFIIKGIGKMLYGPYQHKMKAFNFFKNVSEKRLLKKLPTLAVEYILDDRDMHTITINYGYRTKETEYIPSKELFYKLEDLLDQHFDDSVQ